MKVVLLAAGQSKRMKPIRDKNFLEFFGKPLIAHQLELIAKEFKGPVCVVGGAHNMRALEKMLPKTVFVREQKNLKEGMAGAVLAAADWLGVAPFIIVSGNDIVDAAALHSLNKYISKKNGALVAKRVPYYFPGGYLKLDSQNHIKEIIEKPREGKQPSDLVNLVIHYHPSGERLVEAIKKTKGGGDDRYERALQRLLDTGSRYMAVPYEGPWHAIKYPWHVLDVMNYFLASARKKTSGAHIAPSAKINGAVWLAEGVRVLDNAVIVGPAYIGKNSVIATNALVRGSHIGADCVIGYGTEVARSYLGNNVWTHSNYIGDSVIGSNVSLGAGTVTGNLRLDEREIPVTIGGKKTYSGRTKLGLVTGDNIRVGINSSFMPGVKIGSESFIGAGITVTKDIPENMFVTGSHTLTMKPNTAHASHRLGHHP